jgi:proteasome assembly chaperone (PAC2) family protein
MRDDLMSDPRLTMDECPTMTGARMVLGFSGWMNGGEVSIGTVDYLIRRLGARRVGEIDPQDFYIYNIPGSMEVASLFRPHTQIENGLVIDYQPPQNLIFLDEPNRLVLFEGKEPHLHWEQYAECLLEAAAGFGVERIYFLGSYAGVVPHTRDARLYSSVSDEELKAELLSHGVRFSNYTGPASIATHLTHVASRRGLRMATLVAEIPAYVQGPNPRCIETLTRRLAAILGIDVDMEELRRRSDEFEVRLEEAVREKEGLPEMLSKLESDYDNEFFETEMGDLRHWLESRGIRLD